MEVGIWMLEVGKAPTSLTVAEEAAAFPAGPGQIAPRGTLCPGRVVEEFVGHTAPWVSSARRDAPAGNGNDSGRGEIIPEHPNASLRGRTLSQLRKRF